MTDARWWLVSYDIRDPQRLRRGARILEGYGSRVQYSVFRCWMTRREVERLRWELTELLDPVDDVLMIPLCPGCVAGMVGVHNTSRPDGWPETPVRHTIA